MVLAVLGLLASFVTAWEIADAVALERRGVTVDGSVVAVHWARRRERHVTVEYRLTAGRPVEARVDNVDWAARPHPGDALAVRYDPQAPTDNVRDARAGAVTGDTWIGGVLGLASLAGSALTVTGVIDWELLDLRRRRR